LAVVVECGVVRRLVSAGLAVVFAAGLATAVLAGITRAGAASSPARAEVAQMLRVDTNAPSWLAPGGAGSVGGFAGANEPLRLVGAQGVLLARTRSGPLGRYVFRFRAPARVGRYQLRVLAGAAEASAGTLAVRPLELAAVGDITFGEQVGPAIAAYGAAYPWTAVASRLRSADITVGNLESAVSTRGSAQVKEFTFRGPPSALKPLARLAGFDALTLANNHSGDFGPQAALDTVRSVRAAGMIPFGAGANSFQARRPALLERGGLKVALLGYSDINPLGFNAASASPGTARADTAAIAADVHAARRHADLVVCFFHWGVERRAEPDGRQQQLAAACLNSGAQVVLSAHPHVLGPLTAPRPHTVVSWSLGNFVFPSSGAAARTGILQVRLAKNGVRGYRLLPVLINGFRPQLTSSL
jgi:poly-gamma-glutamate synthesis protein (capsule biosynthesis protein)